MKVQRVRLINQKITWTLLGNDYIPIKPVQDLLNYLQNLERSPNTIRAYASHFKLFWEYLEENHLDWQDVGLLELSKFVAWLRTPYKRNSKEIQRSRSTVNAVATCVCKLYEYHLFEDGSKEILLYKYIRYPDKWYSVKSKLLSLKESKQETRILSIDEVKIIISACSRLRDKFLISLLYQTGMRIGQVLGLRHEDIDPENLSILIKFRDDNANGARAKSLNTNKIFVSSELIDLYADYLINEYIDINSDYVFINLWEGKIGYPMNYTTVVDLFKRISKKTDIRINPHLFRHTHATELYSIGEWDVSHIQQRLGHENINSTLRYIHPTDEDTKKHYFDYLEKRNR